MVSGVLLLAAIFGGYLLGDALLVIALLLVPVGMAGFHLLQQHTYGRMGRAAFWLVVVGSMVMLLSGTIFLKLGQQAGDLSQAWPPLGWVVVALVGGLVSMLGGFMLYGEATLQAKVLPPWCGVAFIAAPPFGVATSILVFFLFSSTTFSEVSMFVVFGVVWLR